MRLSDTIRIYVPVNQLLACIKLCMRKEIIFILSLSEYFKAGLIIAHHSCKYTSSGIKGNSLHSSEIILKQLKSLLSKEIF